MKRILFAMLCIVSALSASAWDGSEGKVYLQNVGSGLWWGAGNSWGTQASLLPHPEYATLHLSDGKYTLESQVSNGGTAYYFNGDFMDNGSPVSLTITQSEDYWTIANGDTYYGYDGSTTVLGKGVDASTDNGKWRIFSEAEMKANLENATLENPVDATFLILDQGFGRNNRNTSFVKNSNISGAWSMTATNLDKAGTNENNCVESYHANFTLSQVLNNVPNGEYEMIAQGFYRQDGSDNTHLPVFYINEGTQTFPLLTGSENSMSAASNSFAEGSYAIAPIRVTVGDGKITLGAKLEGNTMLWCIFDNFTLKYYGIDLSAYETQIATLRSTLTSLVTEPMNATVLGTANTALTETKSVAHNQSAMEAAIAQLNAAVEAANVSIANYVAAKAYLDKSSTLDDAGKAAYAANETVAAVQTAYNNASFEALTDEQKTAMDAAIIVATKAQTTVGSDWTLALVNPSFENGFASGWTNNGMAIQNNTSFPKDGNNYCEKWQPDGTFSVKQTISGIPAGVYQISVKAKTRGVTSGKLFAATIETATKIADEVNTYTVQFACDDNAEIEFGFEGVGTGAGNSWLALDDFHMTLVSAGLPDVTAVTGKMNAEVADAQTTAINTYNGNKTIANYNAAVAAIAAAQASVDAYAAANAAIEKAYALKEAHNFASEAATTTFTTAITNIEGAYNDGTLTDADANAAGTTLGVVVTGWHGGNNNAAPVYLRDGFSLPETFAADPALHVNTWSTEGDSDGSGFSVPFYESWTPDANSLPESTLTGTLTDLPNGLYKISVWVRVAAKTGVDAGDATGITMNVNNGTAVDVTEGEVIGSTQRSIATYEAEGLVKQGELTLNFNIAADANISWFAFKNVKYTKVRDLTPEEAFVAATEEDYAALNAAIEGKVLGFEAGEYAPYNNVEGVVAIAAAKAIDQTANNAQEDVQAATAAITNATWTANTAEVNAVFDGSFEYDYSGQSGNVQPIGWYRNEGTFSGDGYNVRYVTVPSGIEGNTSGHGLFGKFTMQYGKETGYTLPLKAGYYKLTFSYGGYGEQGERIVKLICGESEQEIANIKAKNNQANTKADAYTAFSKVIEVSTAGDYVLSFYRQNTSSQNQIAIVDIKFFRATADDFKDALLTELNNAKAIDATANVGEAAFQIPAAAATTFTAAITTAQGVYDDATATIEGVLQAIEDLKAAEEAYANAELNAPATDKVYNIKVVTSGHAKENNSIIIIPGTSGANNPTGYAMNANFAANTNLSQAFTFTKVSGNTYKISAKLAEGDVYLTNGTLNGSAAGWKASQIQATTDADKAMEFKIAVSSTDGAFNIYNTETNSTIACQTGGNIYTENGNADFALVETTKPSITINTTAAGWGTTMLPFAVTEIPEGVKVYSCDKANGATLTLTEVTALEANKPYIIEGAWDETLTGDAQGTALTYTEGLLTGTYAKMAAPNGCYILQKQDEKVGFFKVDTSVATPNVGANRAYLTAPASGVKGFYLGGDTDGINSLVNDLQNGDIYDLTGRKVQRMQKGNVYIVNGKKVVVK